jgi:hypothetical protein
MSRILQNLLFNYKNQEKSGYHDLEMTPKSPISVIECAENNIDQLYLTANL